MSSKGKFSVIALAFLALFVPFQSASADMGPKPSMEFTLVQEVAGETLTIVNAEMYECGQSDCSDAQLLEEVAVQGFRCYEGNVCHAVAYGFSDYHYLEIEFSDGKLRRSNIFETSSFNGKYDVTIRENDLLVKARFTFDPLSGTTYLILCGCCLFLLVMLTVIIIVIVRRTKYG
jgi:hypothetical protein